MTGGQGRGLSFLEATTNTVVGFGIAMVTGALVFPLYGITINTSENASLSTIFMVVSLVRSYVLRRFFNWIQRK